MSAGILPGTEDLLKLALSFKNYGNSRSLAMDSSKSHYIITETSVGLTELLSLFYGLVSSSSVGELADFSVFLLST